MSHGINPNRAAPTVRATGHMPVALQSAGPTALFSVAHPSSGSGNYKPVNFTDLSTAAAHWSIATWRWDLGDGTISALQNPTHTYALEGTYNISLAVTDSGGASAVITGVLRVPRAPTAHFSYTHRYHTATFTDLSNDDAEIVGWLWNFGGGHTSTAQSPAYDFGADGTYSVTLTVTDEDGLSGSVTNNVTVTNLAPVAGFSFRETALTVSFFDGSTDDSDGLTYAWDFGDSVTSTVQDPTHVYAADGTYTVTLVITDLGALTSTITHSVTVAANAVSFTLLELSSDSTDGTQMVSGPVSPTPGAAIYVHLITARGGSLVVPTVTGLSVTWTQTDTWTFTDAGGNVRRGTTWQGMSPDVQAGTVIFDTGTQLATSFIWAIVEARNVALGGSGYAQHIGAVSYFTAASSKWATVEAKFPVVSTVIIPQGASLTYSAAFLAQVQAAQGAGIKVLAYVDTDYTNIPIATVKATMDNAVTWYDVDGWFLDEATTTTGVSELAYYQAAYDYGKASASTRAKLIALNPGTHTAVEYATRADHIMVAETNVTSYLGRATVAWELSASPSLLWHAVYGVAEGQLDTVIAQSRTLNGGLLWITDDVLPNPYDTVPPYFSSLCTKVATGGGDILTGAAAATVQAVSTTRGSAGTTIHNALSALAASNSAHLAFVGLDIKSTITPDADFVELGDSNVATGNSTLAVYVATNQTDCDPTFSSAFAGITSIEVRGP